MRYYIPIIDLSPHPPIIWATSFWGSITNRVSTKSKIVRRTLVTLCGIALVWVMACIGLYNVMKGSPEQFARVMAKIPGPAAFLVLPFETLWMHARSGVLQVGSPAPDFNLAKLDKTDHIQLSALAKDRPVVLVFGSYT